LRLLRRHVRGRAEDDAGVAHPSLDVECSGPSTALCLVLSKERSR
jgi:hypothetical protein